MTLRSTLSENVFSMYWSSSASRLQLSIKKLKMWLVLKSLLKEVSTGLS
jgi:hypothetical protein